MPVGANAQNPPQQPRPEEGCAQVVGYPLNHCATPGYETPMSLAEIAARPDLYKDRVILHFGPSLQGVDIDAKVLTQRGTPTLAIPGGPACGGHLIIDGQTNTKFCFTQRTLYRGEVGSLAERAYRIYMSRK